MKTVSLKIDGSIFEETEVIRMELNRPRNRYINEALAFYNSAKRKELLALQLKAESALVKKDSLNVLNDFEVLDHGN